MSKLRTLEHKKKPADTDDKLQKELKMTAEGEVLWPCSKHQFVEQRLLNWKRNKIQTIQPKHCVRRWTTHVHGKVNLENPFSLHDLIASSGAFWPTFVALHGLTAREAGLMSVSPSSEDIIISPVSREGTEEEGPSSWKKWPPVS